MLIPNQMIEIKWGRTNSSHYKNLGYEFTKLGDKILVHAEDLLPSSKAIVRVECDDCGEITTTTYQSYLISIKSHECKYYCRKCIQKQDFVINKKQTTTYDKYGDKNIFKTDYFKNKSKETNLKKLGVEYPMQSIAVQNKSKATSDLNGTLLGFKNPETLHKAQLTLSNNGSVMTSSQQIELYNLLLENEYDCQINKPLDVLNLDIELNINNILIDIEVDGRYWHQDVQKDRRRDEFVKSKGYKVLRIIIDRKLPDLDIIKSGINKLINSEHSFYQIVSEDIKNIDNK